MSVVDAFHGNGNTMSFIILACSDIRGQKVNLEFPFDAPPQTLEALRSVLEHTFRLEEDAIKQSMGVTDVRACEPFTISRLQRYEDDTQSWSELTQPQQLQTYDQLYVFRKNSTKADISAQRELPAPRRSVFFTPAGEAAAVGGVGPALAHTPPSSGPAGSSQTVPPAPSSFSPQPPFPYSSSSPAAGAGVGAGYPPASTYPALARGVGGTASAPVAIAGSGDGDGVGGRARSSPGRFGDVNGVDGRPSGTTASTTALNELSAVGGTGTYYYYKERTTPERIEYLFRLADQGGLGYLPLKAYETIFRASDIRFPPEVIRDLHQRFARGLGGSAVGGGGETGMLLEDFQCYGEIFPVAVNVAYQRLTNHEREDALRQAQRDNARAVDGLRQQVKDLEARLAAAKRELQNEEAKRNQLAEDLQELTMQRDPDYCSEEQRLLDKEVSVFHYRERLSKEERDYERLALERRKRTLMHGGPTSSPREPAGYDADRYGPRD